MSVKWGGGGNKKEKYFGFGFRKCDFPLSVRKKCIDIIRRG